MYQVVLLLVQQRIQGRRDYHEFLGYTYIVGVDQTVLYGSTEHLLFLIPAAILFFILGSYSTNCFSDPALPYSTIKFSCPLFKV